MMTVPMDNLSAPSTREHVQRLFNKNNELERGLRKAAQAKIPSDPNAWLQMRENFEAIILEDHEFSELHEIEYSLWQLHYKRIEEFRAHINSASASAGSVAVHGGKGVARTDRIKKIRSVFKSFLSEATGFYHDLILKIRAKYGLPLGYFSEGPGNQINLVKDEKKSVDVKKGLISCHRCLIYLGDLARYKGLYGEGDSIGRDYAAASSYYIQAASLWPSSGNPHHQLAILASYSGDDLVAVYRYYRSLAVDCPFSTARDNLIIVFEKNRQSYSQLPRDARTNSVKRMNGRGRGRGETMLAVKDVKTESTSKGEFSIPEIYKTFCVRFVRLNGILFTRTSLETFGEVFSLIISDLHDLLSYGSEEELNFGSDATENGLFIVRLIAILIFMVHNVNKESEGQSYAEILQRSVLLQNAFTSAFELVGHILKRCLQLQDISSSYLLPAILVFIEWLACHPDIATGSDVEIKQATARSFFWTQCISFLNKLILSGLVFVDGDEGETCFSEMSRYDEGETGNRLALWEDFELRGFLPLLPAQLILDFSRKFSFGNDASKKDKRARMQRILAAGRALMNVVRVDQQRIYFDPEQKKFTIGIEPKRCERNMITPALDVTSSNGLKQGMPIEKTMNLGVMQPMEQFCAEVEEEDEVIVFKPTVSEKHSDVSIPKSITYEALKPVEDSSRDDWENYARGLSAPQLQVSGSSASLQLPMSFANTISRPLQHIDPSTSKWILEQQASLTDGLKSVSISGNGLVPKDEFQQGPDPHAFSLPCSSYENLNPIGILSGPTACLEAGIPSKYDSTVPFAANGDDPIMKLSFVPTNLRRSPVSRPVRHFGPPPGFSPVPPKQFSDSMAGSVSRNEHPLLDDYSWLDGYQMSSAGGTNLNNPLNHAGDVYLNNPLNHAGDVYLNNPLNHAGDVYSHVLGNRNISAGMMSFPFPGKQSPNMQAEVENQKKWLDHQHLEHLKLNKEQQQQQQQLLQLQLQRGSQQSAPLPELYQGPSLWSGQFFV